MEEAPGKLLDVLFTYFRKTPTSTKTFLQFLLVRQNVVMEVTEYGPYITGVTIRTPDLQTVIYKSKKFSIQDALNEIGITGNLHDKIKLQVREIKRVVKSQSPTEEEIYLL